MRKSVHLLSMKMISAGVSRTARESNCGEQTSSIENNTQWEGNYIQYFESREFFFQLLTLFFSLFLWKSLKFFYRQSSSPIEKRQSEPRQSVVRRFGFVPYLPQPFQFHSIPRPEFPPFLLQAPIFPPGKNCFLFSNIHTHAVKTSLSHPTYTHTHNISK